MRMATLAAGGRITEEIVDEEIERLRAGWRAAAGADVRHRSAGTGCCRAAVQADVDPFDRVQLAEVLRVCRGARPRCRRPAGACSASSRARKAAPNDADRLRKYLARFGLEWKTVKALRIIA